MLVAVRRHAALACAALVVIVVVVAGARSPAAAQTSSVDRVPASGRRARARSVPRARHRRTGRDIAASSTTPPPALPSRRPRAGRSVFAGDVAGVLWVTLRHPDGVRTTYGPLATIAVVAGQPVTHGRRPRHDRRPAAVDRARRRQLRRPGAVAVRRRRRSAPRAGTDVACRRFRPSSFGVGDVAVTRRGPRGALVGTRPGHREGRRGVRRNTGAVRRWARWMHSSCGSARQDHCTTNDVPVATPTEPAARGPGRRARLDERQRRHRRCRHRITRLRPRRRRAVLVSRRPGAGDPASEHGTGLARGHARTTTSDTAGDLQAAAARLSDVLRAVAAAAPAGTIRRRVRAQPGRARRAHRARRSRHARSVRARADRRRW